MNKPAFFSCDWGTSNFRLRLVQRDDLTVLHEVENDKGFGGFPAGTGRDEKLSVLRNAIQETGAVTGEQTDGIPVVISGMASSTIGIEELPYAPVPLSLRGGQFRTTTLALGENEVLLISGISTENDVMRGEETQLLGLLSKEMRGSDALIIHPGTHSKHMSISGDGLVGFRSFMTGESFKLYTTHSILKASVEDGPLLETPFRQGVTYGAETPLLHALFSTRTSVLFGKRNPKEAFHFVSGILIGAELSAVEECNKKIFICSGGKLHEPYRIAAGILLPGAVVTDPEWEEGAVIRGQALVAEAKGFLKV